jgi:UDP-3-O-[3-hydroxymyristoyl] glucosamine N-acyltransferase
MSSTYTLEYLAHYLGADLLLKPGAAQGDQIISGLTTLELAGPGQITFLSNPKYAKHLLTTRASAVIMSKDFIQESPVSVLVMNNPALGSSKIAALFQKQPKDPLGIHVSAIVDPSAEIHSSASIGAGVVLGPGVKIGEQVIIRAGCVLMDDVSIGAQTVLYPRVTLYPDVQLGARCIIHSGAVIGSDGFGLANDRGKWVKIAQLGSVIISDDVEIGANTTIDRGALCDTRIGTGVKIDNQVHIAHNVIIGDHTAIAGQVGIAGSTEIGKHCLIGGGSGINGHIKIGNQVHFAAHSSVTRSIDKPGIYVSVIPVCEQRAWHKNVARFNQLDELARRLKQCEKILNLGKVRQDQEEGVIGE